MKVTCAQCLSVYSISEEKLRKEVSRTTCRKCGNRIEIRRPSGIPKITSLPSFSEIVKKTSHSDMENAVPKRINDDERTHLDESRIEFRRPETNTNLAFGPNVSFGIKESSFEESDKSLKTAPLLHTLPETQEPLYRLDWAGVFLFNIVGLLGVVISLFKANIWLEPLGLSIVIFGVMGSIILVLTSKFGQKEGGLYLSFGLSLLSAVGFVIGYVMIAMN